MLRELLASSRASSLHPASCRADSEPTVLKAMISGPAGRKFSTVPMVAKPGMTNVKVVIRTAVSNV